MIVDAHAHVLREVRGITGTGPTTSLAYGKVQWGTDRVLRLLPPTCATTSFPPEMLLEHMDWARVDKAVLLQGPFYGEDNHLVARAVSQWPNRFVGAAYLDPGSPEAPQAFRQVTEAEGFRILKLELSEATGFLGLYPNLRLESNALAWLWEAAESQDLTVTLDLGSVGSRSYQTGAVKAVLERHPRLKIVIAHLGQPPAGEHASERLDQCWQEQVLLARHANVWLDLAALPAYWSTEDYPFTTARAYIRRAVELVGADKIMWGTDVPGLLSQATYPQLLHFVFQHCEFLSSSDLEKILGGNAWQVYGH